VFEDVGEQPGIAPSQPVKIPLRDFPAGNVPFALYAQNVRLQRGQAAVFQAVPEQPARRVQQIQVGQFVKAARHPVQNEARSQQVDVKGFAVEGHEEFFLRGDFLKAGQRRGLLAEIARQNLPDVKPAFFEPAQADEKRHGSRSAGKSRGFRVQKERVGRVISAQDRVVGEHARRGHVDIKSLEDAAVAVAAGAGKKTPGQKETSVPVFALLPLQDFAKRPVAARPCFILRSPGARGRARDNAVDASSQIVDPELFFR